ncbi:MAG: hypothetical protein R2874_03115 [Desulfobacterales bacterium]
MGRGSLREFFLLEGDEHLKLVENREIMIDGKMPINPSGGVIAANPITAPLPLSGRLKPPNRCGVTPVRIRYHARESCVSVIFRRDHVDGFNHA